MDLSKLVKETLYISYDSLNIIYKLTISSLKIWLDNKVQNPEYLMSKLQT